MGQHRWRGTAAGFLAVGTFGVLAVSWVKATPPPAPGREMPPHVRDFVRRTQVSLDEPGAWRGKTLRAKQARLAALEGRGGVAGASAARGVGGTLFVPVVLVGFQNRPIPDAARDNLATELFTGPWPTRTLTEFYDEISYSNLVMTGEVLNAGLLSQNDSFYEGTTNGLGSDASISNLISEAVAALDSVVDFGRYDNDGDDGMPNSGDDDGRVDFIAFVQPEKGAECAGAFSNIWSHRWTYTGWTGSSLATNDPSASGGTIQINDYTIQPAVSCDGGLIEVGVFCHEFGHALGLPDLYDYDSGAAASEGLGHWCLMAGGNWNTPTDPAHMSAWAKAEVGWLVPTLLTSPDEAIALPQVETNPVAAKIVHETRGREYFLIENRQPVGSDINLPTCGLAIYHIDETQINNDNQNCPPFVSTANYLIALEQADGTCDLEANANRGDDGDLFPGSNDNREFTPTSTPNSLPYSGLGADISITNISDCAETMTFDVTVVPLPPATASPLDIVFLVDLTGSYIDDLPIIQEQFTDIVNDIRGVFPDARFGLASFRDFPFGSFGEPTDFAYRLELELTGDAADPSSSFQMAFTELRAGDGLDLPEAQYEALFQLLTGAGRDLDGDGIRGNSAGEIPPTPMNWGSTRTPVIYLLTDASFHDSDSEMYPGPDLLPAAGRSDVLSELAAPTTLPGVPIVFVLNPEDGGASITSGQSGSGNPFEPSRLAMQAQEIAVATAGAFLPAGRNTIELRSAVRRSLAILEAGLPQIGDCCAGGGCIRGVVKRDCIELLNGSFARDCADCVRSSCPDGACTGFENECDCPQDCGVPPGREDSCSDVQDNDCDRLTDCSDPDCAASDACHTCSPTLNPSQDHAIDLADYVFFPPCMGETGNAGSCGSLDIDCSGDVTLRDFGVFQGVFALCLPGAACSDRDACTTADRCVEGVCIGGPRRTCDDGNPCTDEACDPLRGCLFTPNTARCDDGVFCNGADKCAQGSCSLHEGDPCPGPDGDSNCSESCNEPARSCSGPDPNHSPCDDGLFCNGADRCAQGSCSEHQGNPCPGPDGDANCLESCNEAADNCTAPDPENSICNDGLFCNGTDGCSNGACSKHAGNPCAGAPECRNVCNEAADHCFLPSGTPCSDDGNVCTDNICNGSGSCVPVPNTRSCEDGLFCNGTDVCSGGVCVHSGNPCGAECCFGCSNTTGCFCACPLSCFGCP